MIASTDKPGFFTRLKQHHIYRVATVYAVAAWILIQLSNSVFPDFGLSHGAVRVLIVTLLLGFPVVLVNAWIFIEPRDPEQLGRWQRLRWKLGALLSVAVIVFVVVSGGYIWRVSERHAQQIALLSPAAPSMTSVFSPPANSIAVLPFVNLSDDPKQQYFSDGITEELTDALGQITALRVIAWESASAYRDSQQTSSEIGKTLNVANLLHGSIRREGNQVRVTVELVNTSTGFQLWSAQYDEVLKNIFAVQDKITQAIAGALQVKFASAQAVPTVNPEAYEYYLKGHAALDRQSAASLVEAKEYFGKAIALDPSYANAHAWLAHAYYLQAQYSTLPLNTALSKARAAANRALLLDPRNVPALVALGVVDTLNNNPTQAKTELEQALALDPSDDAAHVDYGNLLPLKLSLDQQQQAVLLNPRDWAAQYNLANAHMDLGNYEQALMPAHEMVRLSPDEIDSAFILAFIYQQLRRNQDMLDAFDLVKPSTALDKQLLDAGRLTYRSLLETDLRPQALAALAFLRHTDLSPSSQGDLIQLYLALAQVKPALQLLEGLCAHSSAACADLAIYPIYTPLHNNPHFQKLAKQYTTVTLE